MRTTADEKLDEAADYINKALLAFNRIVVERCNGYDEYTQEYTAKIKKYHLELLEIRDGLNRQIS